MYKYQINMYWSNADNCFITEVPELAGCMSDGKTPQEAINNTQTVIKEWIECATERGQSIPQPKCESEAV
jgi:predicted RNase H-like HicB family nuclease